MRDSPDENLPVTDPAFDKEPESAVSQMPKSVPSETATQTPTKVLVRCPDCPWRAGFKDEHTYCETCKGAGRVEAEPLA